MGKAALWDLDQGRRGIVIKSGVNEHTGRGFVYYRPPNSFGTHIIENIDPKAMLLQKRWSSKPGTAEDNLILFSGENGSSKLLKDILGNKLPEYIEAMRVQKEAAERQSAVSQTMQEEAASRTEDIAAKARELAETSTIRMKEEEDKLRIKRIPDEQY